MFVQALATVYHYTENTTVLNRMINVTEAIYNYFYVSGGVQYAQTHTFNHVVKTYNGDNSDENKTAWDIGTMQQALLINYLHTSNSSYLEAVKLSEKFLLTLDNYLLNNLGTRMAQWNSTHMWLLDQFKHSVIWYASSTPKAAITIYNLNESSVYHKDEYRQNAYKTYYALSVHHRISYLKERFGMPEGVRLDNPEINIFGNEVYVWFNYSTPLLKFYRMFPTSEWQTGTFDTLTEFLNKFGTDLSIVHATSTILNAGWNSFTAWVADVGKTLIQVNASLHLDNVNFTVITFDYGNGTQISLYWLQATNEYWVEDTTMTVTSDTTIWIYCLEAGEWSHNYGS